MNELLQITWCVYAKQKNGKATNLTIDSYENRFNYSFDFDSLMIEKRLKRMIRLCFYKFSKYQKLPVIYLNICHRDIGLSKRYLQGPFHFNWLEIQQVREVFKKMKLETGRVTSTDLEILHQTYLTVKKTYPENSDRRIYFLATYSLFFFSFKNDINYDVAIKFRPYGGLICIGNSSLDKYLNDSKIFQLHAILQNAAGFVHELYNPGPTYCYMLP